MTPDEIGKLKAARERLCRQRDTIATDIATGDFDSVELAGDLTVVLTAIEAVDRALNEAGHPYMSDRLRGEAEQAHPIQPHA